MKKIPALNQLKEWDKITGKKIPGGSYALMETAARKVTECILELYPGLREVHIFCGHGNNGGDGYAIARMLLFHGYRVRVYGIHVSKIKSAETLKNVKKLLNSGVQILDPLEFFPDEFTAGSLVIDAMLGYGLNRPPEGIYQQVIERLNRIPALKVAVDIPSGMSYSGIVQKNGLVFKADVTVTLGVYKPAFLISENINCTGRIILKDIGLDEEYGKSIKTNLFLLEKSATVAGIVHRKLTGHKYDYGHLLAVGGSPGKAGAIYMSAKAAFRSGAGLVTFLSVPENRSVLQNLLPEAMMCNPLENGDSTGDIPEIPDKISAALCGPGMGTSPQSKSYLKTVLAEMKKRKTPAVIDADALNIIAGDRSLVDLIPPGSILTPHIGEFRRLIGTPGNSQSYIENAAILSKTFNAVVVLKSSVTLIADTDGRTYVSLFGHPVLSKAGTGDILAGIIAGILSQGMDSLQSAITGVCIQGFCARRFAQTHHENTLLSAELTEYISDVLTDISSSAGITG